MLNLNVQFCCYCCWLHFCLWLVANFQKETTGGGFSVEKVVMGDLSPLRKQSSVAGVDCAGQGWSEPTQGTTQAMLRMWHLSCMYKEALSSCLGSTWWDWNLREAQSGFRKDLSEVRLCLQRPMARRQSVYPAANRVSTEKWRKSTASGRAGRL